MLLRSSRSFFNNLTLTRSADFYLRFGFTSLMPSGDIYSNLSSLEPFGAFNETHDPATLIERIPGSRFFLLRYEDPDDCQLKQSSHHHCTANKTPIEAQQIHLNPDPKLIVTRKSSSLRRSWPNISSLCFGVNHLLLLLWEKPLDPLQQCWQRSSNNEQLVPNLACITARGLSHNLTWALP